MPAPMKPRAQRIGAWLYGLSSAVLTIAGVYELFPKLRGTVLLLVLLVLWVIYGVAWRWLFFERQPELEKKIPLSSKELRKRKKEFFDSLEQR